jgi:hypothetical protein
MLALSIGPSRQGFFTARSAGRTAHRRRSELRPKNTALDVGSSKQATIHYQRLRCCSGPPAGPTHGSSRTAGGCNAYVQ